MVKLNKIYTRTGDDGTTGLVDGSRISKTSPLLSAIGDVDEANSAIGVAIAALPPGPVAAALTRFQNDLFDLGADLATPDGITGALRVTPGQVALIETAIDLLNAELEPLASFVLPGGSAASGALHLARAIVRRAERSAVAAGEVSAIRPVVLAYLNRLSDYLFVAARHVNQSATGDVLWVPGASRADGN
jgi:cob(I)alamin adenosyltransferase